MHHGEFRDPRLVTVYDAECPWSRDDDFFVSVLADEPATDILDLGCGTGRLAIALAARLPARHLAAGRHHVHHLGGGDVRGGRCGQLHPPLRLPGR
jgi:hypothetical protein